MPASSRISVTRSFGLLVIVCIFVRCYITDICFVFFFFSSRRRHTRLQGDWSSDVCSSDLRSAGGARGSWTLRLPLELARPAIDTTPLPAAPPDSLFRPERGDYRSAWHALEIGRASCRERV